MVGRLFSSGARAERISAFLGGEGPIDFARLARLQRDVESASARKLAVRFARIAKAASPGALSSESANILPLLESWDGAYDASSQAPAAFELLLCHFARLFYARKEIAAYSAGWVVRDLIRADVEAADDARIRPLVLRALALTAKSLGAQSWGELHRLRLDHPLGALPSGRRYRYFDLPASGGSETVMKTANGLVYGSHAARLGSNARHISSLSGLDENYFALLGGQDGWFGSMNFADQIQLWRKGEYIQVPLQPEPVRIAFPFVTELVPALRPASP